MTRRLAFLLAAAALTAPLALAAAAASPAGAAAPEQDPAQHGAHDGFGDVERWVRVFEDPGRREWQKPLKVVELLSVSPGQQVADLGAGTGYFLPMLCTALGGRGGVYAVDVEPAMVEHIRQRHDPACEDILVPVLASPDDPKLPDDTLDLVLVVDTWHHIEGRVAYLGRLRRSLRKGGRVAIIDWREGELPLGPPPEERLPRAQVIEEFERAGWRFDSESTMLPYQYFLIFEQPLD